MITKRTPVTVILLVSSWIIFITGLVIGGFYYFTSLKIALGIVFGSIILAAAVRMLGNIGQMLFELSAYSLSFLKDIGRGTQDNSHYLQSLNQSLKDNSQEIKQVLEDNSQEINQSLKDNSQEINQFLKDNSQEINQFLKDNFPVLIQSFKDTTQALQQHLQKINQSLKDNSQEIKQVLEDNSQEIKQALQWNFRDSDQTLQQINCDSRDINKDIHDIRNFFEKIEKHLNLKK